MIIRSGQPSGVKDVNNVIVSLTTRGRLVTLTAITGVAHVDCQGEIMGVGHSDMGGKDLALQSLSVGIGSAEMVNTGLTDSTDVVADAGELVNPFQGITNLFPAETGSVVGMDGDRSDDVLVRPRQLLGELGPATSHPI